MAGPIKTIHQGLTSVGNAIGRAFTLPAAVTAPFSNAATQMQNAAASLANPPAAAPVAQAANSPAPPVQSPGGGPGKQAAQNQFSFLSAASKAASAGVSGGGATGKSLLGQ